MAPGTGESTPQPQPAQTEQAPRDPAVAALVKRSMDRGFWKRIFQTRALKKTSQESTYGNRYDSENKKVHVNTPDAGASRVQSTVSLEDAAGIRHNTARAFAGEIDANRTDTGHIMRNYAQEYLDILSEEADEAREAKEAKTEGRAPLEGEAAEKRAQEVAERTAAKKEFERKLVSVNMPAGEVNLGEVGQRVVDLAVSEAAKRVASEVADRMTRMGATKEYYRNAPHVIVSNDADGGISVTTAYGPVDVAEDGSIMPSHARPFRRSNVPWPTRAKSRLLDYEEPGVEVSTLRVQKADQGLVRGGEAQGWSMSYVSPDGTRSGDTQSFRTEIRNEQLRDVFADSKNHTTRLYRHEGKPIDAMDMYTRGNLTDAQKALYNQTVTIVSTSPRVQEFDLGRVLQPELNYRLAHSEDTSPIVVSDVDGHTATHQEGLRVSGVTRSEQTGGSEKGKYQELYTPKGEVFIRADMYREAAQQLAGGQLDRFLIASAGLGTTVTPEQLAQNRGLIRVNLLNEGQVPPEGSKEITAEQLKGALDNQAVVVRGIADGRMQLNLDDLDQVDAELIAVALGFERSEDNKFSVEAERGLVGDMQNVKGTEGRTKRELVKELVRRKFDRGEEDVFEDESRGVLAEALLDKVAPRETADLLIDLADINGSLNAAMDAIASPREQLSPADRTRLAREIGRLTEKRGRLFAGVPEDRRATLESLLSSGNMSPETVMDRAVSAFEALRQARLSGSEPEQLGRAALNIEQLGDRLGISGPLLERLKALMAPSEGGRLGRMTAELRAAEGNPEETRAAWQRAVENNPELRAILDDMARKKLEEAATLAGQFGAASRSNT